MGWLLFKLKHYHLSTRWPISKKDSLLLQVSIYSFDCGVVLSCSRASIGFVGEDGKRPSALS